jgi:hypothetical protein
MASILITHLFVGPLCYVLGFCYFYVLNNGPKPIYAQLGLGFACAYLSISL